MNAYTVIYIHPDNGQICAEHVQAENAMAAFTAAAEETSEAEFVLALEGHNLEGETLHFPGDCVVCAETVLEQPEVFS